MTSIGFLKMLVVCVCVHGFGFYFFLLAQFSRHCMRRIVFRLAYPVVRRRCREKACKEPQYSHLTTVAMATAVRRERKKGELNGFSQC
jgi:hypothetical protein